MGKLQRVSFAVGAWAIVSTCGSTRVELPVDFTPTGTAEWIETASGGEIAQVRFVNSMTGTHSLAVVADSHLAFDGVGFRGATPYAEVGSGETRFELRDSHGAVLATLEPPLVSSARYTLVAGRDQTGVPQLELRRDDTAPVMVAARL